MLFSSWILKFCREEGIQGLFRGNLLNVLRIVPTKVGKQMLAIITILLYAKKWGSYI